jgi:hypothetical protein
MPGAKFRDAVGIRLIVVHHSRSIAVDCNGNRVDPAKLFGGNAVHAERFFRALIFGGKMPASLRILSTRSWLRAFSALSWFEIFPAKLQRDLGLTGLLISFSASRSTSVLAGPARV